MMLNLNRCVYLATLMAAVIVIGPGASQGAPKAENAKSAEAKVKRPRLPNYYAGVITEAQREKINAVQDQFSTQLREKRAEVKALAEQQDAAIEKVLTPAQRKQVEEARATAKAKRQARAKQDAAEADAKNAEAEAKKETKTKSAEKS